MNLPNKLTILRVFLVPVFLVCYYINFPFHYWVSLFIFAAASYTDSLDGKIARKNNLTTTFGKFMDPLADKILVTAALLCFIETGLTGAIPLIIITTREFTVSGLRLVTAGEGVVVPANIWGKLKTAFTMIAIIAALLYASVFGESGINYAVTGEFTGNNDNLISVSYVIIQVLVWISALLTFVSGMQYLKVYWKYVDSDK